MPKRRHIDLPGNLTKLTNMNIIILAAGQGKRMHSNLPKVLHPLAGKALAQHVIDTARALVPEKLIVVAGHGGEIVRSTLSASDICWAEQRQQLGTGHAVAQALAQLGAAEQTLVLYGDVPLTAVATLKRLLQVAKDGLGILTVNLDHPTGYGRIVRDAAGHVRNIVEEKDASASERQISEVNTGIMAMPTARLADWIGQLKNENAQGEYYLTDIVALAVAEGLPVRTAQPAAEWEVLGVNSKVQLAELERQHQRNLADGLLVAGVRLADPARIDIRGELRHGRDVFIDVGCVFEGNVELGDAVEIGPYCVLKNVKVGAGTRLPPSVILITQKSARTACSAPMPACAPAPGSGRKCISGILLKSKTAALPPSPKLITWPTLATPKSASALMLAPAPSPAITTAPTSSRPSSKTTFSSVPIPSSSHRLPWGAAPHWVPVPR
jgi:UDP-N-acetylglucosamine diphosphorylase/glucosamine-1-phosphate N-acetyltransferase